ncbi:MAG: glycosyltransferase [Candidatus Lokiarchaeota archaeon]|nr:glycosyltransferase [Candidatus Lokiarchaeota archaeon]
MKIGIFSKLGASGGSEHRCAEMANGIVRHTDHSCTILCEKDLNRHIEDKLDDRINIIKRVFKPKPENVECLYDFDSLLIVNSDSYSFAKADYWLGKTEHHDYEVDLSRIKQMAFLFNFVISPSKKLASLEKYVDDLRIICANKKFFHHITEKSGHACVRHLPRITLDSPIDPESITDVKTNSDKIRIGKHSKAHGYKFNEEHKKLIDMVNDKYGDKVSWDFLGVPSDRAAEICDIPNVTIRKEYSVPVGDYLRDIDIFLFFISWGRNEPWSRAVAEGLMAGCPVLATNKAGNLDQILHGNNGYLCDDLDGFYKWLCYLIENPDMINKLGRNGRIYSKSFSSANIIRQYIEFITA